MLLKSGLQLGHVVAQSCVLILSFSFLLKIWGSRLSLGFYYFSKIVCRYWGWIRMPGVFSEVECRRVNWGKDRKEGGAEAELTLSGAI